MCSGSIFRPINNVVEDVSGARASVRQGVSRQRLIAKHASGRLSWIAWHANAKLQQRNSVQKCRHCVGSRQSSSERKTLRSLA